MPKDIAIETAENQLDVSCDVTWSILMAQRDILQCIRSSLLENPPAGQLTELTAFSSARL